MKTRAESLDADLDLLKVAFSEISRLSAEVAIEQPNKNNNSSARDGNTRTS
jgi:vacuolar protein sorting-associated protein 51